MSSPRRRGLNTDTTTEQAQRRIPSPVGAAAATPTKAATRRAESATKERVNLYISADLIDQARDAAVALYATPGAPRSLSGIFESALARELTRLAAEYNDGTQFPHRAVELQAGRPASL